MSLFSRLTAVRNQIAQHIHQKIEHHKAERARHRFYFHDVTPVKRETHSYHENYVYAANEDMRNANVNLVWSPKPPLHTIKLFKPYLQTIRVDHVICGHYAVMDAVLRHQKTEPMKFARPKAFANVENMTKLLPRPNAAYELIEHLVTDAPVRHWVAPHQKTNFFSSQLAALPKPPNGEERHQTYFIHAASHAMNVTLKVKNVNNDLRYSVSVYEPNNTYNHQKIQFFDPQDAEGLSFSDFFNAAAISDLCDRRVAGGKPPYPKISPDNVWTLFPLKDTVDETNEWCDIPTLLKIHRWDKDRPNGELQRASKSSFANWLLRSQTDTSN